eukprot:GHVS01019696.1.p1 GENE.GHVS01019696.1~~GHVS01019696.1.p1  ORF type:complete len:746 (-),score=128.55 GHVS01019696.1:289-2526(-)
MQRPLSFLHPANTCDTADRNNVVVGSVEGAFLSSASGNSTNGGTEELEVMRRQLEQLQRYCIGLERSLMDHMATCVTNPTIGLHDRRVGVASCAPPARAVSAARLPTPSASPPERSGVEVGAFDMWRSPAIGGAAAAPPQVPLIAALPERQEGANGEDNGDCRWYNKQTGSSLDGCSEFRMRLDHHRGDGVVKTPRSRSGDVSTVGSDGAAIGEKSEKYPSVDSPKSDDTAAGNHRSARLLSAEGRREEGSEIFAGMPACEAEGAVARPEAPAEENGTPLYQFVWKISKLSNMCKRVGPLECLVSPRFDSTSPELGSVYLMLNTPHHIYHNHTRKTTTASTPPSPHEEIASGVASPTREGGGKSPSAGCRSSVVIGGANGSMQKNGMEAVEECTSGHLVRFQLEVSGRKADYRLLNSSQNAWEGFASFALFGDVWDPVADSITIVTNVMKIFPNPQVSADSHFQTFDRRRSWSAAAALPSSCPLSPISIPSPPLFSPTSFQHPRHSPAIPSPASFHTSPPHPRLLPSPAFTSSSSDHIYHSSSFSSSWQPPLCPSKPRPIGRPPPPLMKSAAHVDPHTHPASAPPGFEPLRHCPSPSFSPQKGTIYPLSSSVNSSASPNRSAALVTLLPAGHTSYCPPSPALSHSPTSVQAKKDIGLEVVYRMLLAGCACEEVVEREKHFELAVVASEYNSDCICFGVQKVLVHPNPDDQQFNESLYKTLLRDVLPILKHHSLTDALAYCQCLLA